MENVKFVIPVKAEQFIFEDEKYDWKYFYISKTGKHIGGILESLHRGNLVITPMEFEEIMLKPLVEKKLREKEFNYLEEYHEDLSLAKLKRKCGVRKKSVIPNL